MCKTGDHGNAMLPKKVRISKIPSKIFCTARYEHKSSKFSFKLFKKVEKNHSWSDLGPRSDWEKLIQMLIRSGEIPSPRQTSIDKTNGCAMNSERGALVRGSDPPSCHSVQRPVARHEAGWPWVDSMLRSKAYHRVSCSWSVCWQFSTWKRKFRRVQQREQIILNIFSLFSP